MERSENWPDLWSPILKFRDIHFYSSLQRVIGAHFQESSFSIRLRLPREPIPAPGGDRWDQQPEGREAPGIDEKKDEQKRRRYATPFHRYCQKAEVCFLTPTPKLGAGNTIHNTVLS